MNIKLVRLKTPHQPSYMTVLQPAESMTSPDFKTIGTSISLVDQKEMENTGWNPSLDIYIARHLFG